MSLFLALSALCSSLRPAPLSGWVPPQSPSASIDAWGEEVDELGFLARSIAFGLIALCVMALCCSFAACLVWLCCRRRRSRPEEDTINFAEIDDNDAVPPTIQPFPAWPGPEAATPYPPAA
jgi:hypothetical protein